MSMNASKAQSRRVWTSFGIAVRLFPFLSAKEVCFHQRLNRFFYEAAVGRVITRLNVEQDHFFTYWQGGLLSNVVVAYGYGGKAVKCIQTMF